MELLKNSQFLKLWGNQILLQIAFNLCNFTALLLIDHLTGSRYSLALFYSAITIPAFLVGILAGSIVDISNRKRLMLTTDAALTGLFLLYALVTNRFETLLGIAFLSASAAQFFTPAEAATIPFLVSGKLLEKANALFLFTGLGSVMIGYAIAGPIIQIFGGLGQGGEKVAFLMASLMTLTGFLLRLGFNTVETTKPLEDGEGIFKRTFVLTKEVILTAKKQSKIYLPIGLLTLMEFNIGILSILFIDYVKNYLSLPATATSYFLVLPLIVGLGFGAFLLGRVVIFVKRGAAIVISCFGFGLVILILGLIATYSEVLGIFYLRYLTAVGAFFVGLAAVFIATYSKTLLQENTPKEMLGRVFSLVTIGASAIAPLPVLLVSLLTERVDVALVFILLGVFLTAVSLIFGPKIRSEIDRQRAFG